MGPSALARVRGRLRAAAGSLSWRSLLADVLVVVSWVAAVSIAVRLSGTSKVTYYAVVFGGVVAYSIVRAWTGGYRRD